MMPNGTTNARRASAGTAMLVARHLMLVLIAVPCVATAAPAQQYPTRPIRLVVPWASGSPSDVLGRLVALRFSATLGQPVVVDNRAGASGTIGSTVVARAAPDGHTLLMAGTATHGQAPALRPKLAYDPVKDFAPISVIASVPFILVVSPSVPAKSVKELVALAKSRPGELNYASSGTGTTTHLTGELFKRATGIDMIHVPYKSTEPATIDLSSGRTHVMFSGIAVLMPHVKAGRLRGLAVASAERSVLLPNLPTMIESGVPGFTAAVWSSLMAPGATPPEIVARLHAETVKMLNDPGMREKLLALGLELVGSTPREFRAYLNEELAKWGKVITALGIKEE